MLNVKIHTSTKMSFWSEAPSSPTIFKQLYLLALRRKSWNWTTWEMGKLLLRNPAENKTLKNCISQNIICDASIEIENGEKTKKMKQNKSFEMFNIKLMKYLCCTSLGVVMRSLS